MRDKNCNSGGIAQLNQGRWIHECSCHHCWTAGERLGTMGQSLTREQKNHMDVLQKILKTYGDNLSQLSLVTLLAWAPDNCSWFPKEGTLNITVWKHVRDELGQQNDEKSKSLLITQHQVFLALSRLQTVNEANLPHYIARQPHQQQAEIKNSSCCLCITIPSLMILLTQA